MSEYPNRFRWPDLQSTANYQALKALLAQAHLFLLGQEPYLITSRCPPRSPVAVVGKPLRDQTAEPCKFIWWDLHEADLQLPHTLLLADGRRLRFAKGSYRQLRDCPPNGEEWELIELEPIFSRYGWD